MTRWVGLLYSTVIGPQRRVRSADMLALAERLRLDEARTVLSSGNFIFSSDRDEAALARMIGDEVSALYGREIPVLVRAEADWRALVAANPFEMETRSTPKQIGVRIMAAQPDDGVVKRLTEKRAPAEKLAITDRAIWAHAPGDPAKSTLMRAINAAWAGVGTSRNGSAIQKILAGFDG